MIINILLITFIILVSGVTYQQISLKRDRRRFIPSGKLIDIEETQLHMHADGEAKPTVVFDCGHGVCLADSDWSLVQPGVSKIARTVVYGREGMGLSQKSKQPRTSEQIVDELHTLLENSKEKAPYILVGHSLGGLNMCRSCRWRFL